ncbi:hypothetical protein M422DRAFT_243618 [Sphaerobolus stellatus SS14]|nr:hypothetical protein M422DRAFT_243618 [Sphaerobolus stellatus SS14]
MSSHWRSIAKCNPSLWKEININPTRIKFAWFCAELASVDLDVILDPDRDPRSFVWNLIPPACQFIHQNAHRISTLIVFNSHPSMEIFLTTPFPKLTTSIFSFNRYRVAVPKPFMDNLPTLALFGGDAPMLWRVAWICDKLPSLSKTPWNNLTTLALHFSTQNLDNLDWSHYMSLFRRNPNLETLTLPIPRVIEYFNPIPIPLLSLHKANFNANTIQNLKAFIQAIFISGIQHIGMFIERSASFYDVHSTLASQASLLSLLDEIVRCELRPTSYVHLQCWNIDNQRTFKVNWLLQDSDADTSHLGKNAVYYKATPLALDLASF